MLAQSAATAYSIRSITFQVASSRTGETYTVTCSPLDGRVQDCTCKSRRFRPQWACRHMKAVSQKDHSGLKPRVAVQMFCREAC